MSRCDPFIPPTFNMPFGPGSIAGAVRTRAPPPPSRRPNSVPGETAMPATQRGPAAGGDPGLVVGESVLGLLSDV